MTLLVLLLPLFCTNDSMNEPEYGRGTFSRWSLWYAETSNNPVIASSNTRNHTLRSIDLQSVLNAFVTEACMVGAIVNVLIW
jgi:hypothetical protein